MGFPHPKQIIQLRQQNSATDRCLEALTSGPSLACLYSSSSSRASWSVLGSMSRHMSHRSEITASGPLRSSACPTAARRRIRAALAPLFRTNSRVRKSAPRRSARRSCCAPTGGLKPTINTQCRRPSVVTRKHSRSSTINNGIGTQKMPQEQARSTSKKPIFGAS